MVNVSQDLAPARLHALRTPLNQIIGYAELMIEQAEEDRNETYLPDLSKIRAAGRELLGLLGENSQVRAGEARTVATEILPLVPLLRGSLSSAAKVLIVDDNAMNREILARRVEKEGHLVGLAANGIEALACLRSESYDLVLLDIMMPEMDGFEALQLMKADVELQNIPVIMISAQDDEASVVRCIENGADDFLPKPINVTVLRARMGASLAKKRTHDRESVLLEQLQENLRRLQELEQLREDMTGMVVHDLRTPLTSLIAGMRSLEVVGELSDIQKEMTGIALQGGETLLGMINDLLDVARMDAGSMQLEYSEIQPFTLITSAKGQVSELGKGKGLRIVERVNGDLPAFKGDYEKLVRVLVNLLGNAIKFTPKEGVIYLSVRKSDDVGSLEFAVEDSGEGIPAEAFEQIFQKFGQVESRKAGRSMSTGLGLTFCKLAVEAHGGTIKVESEQGRGSKFSFSIPTVRTVAE